MVLKEYKPSVPRAPNLRRPNRAKGRLMVMISGVTFRIAITCDGFVGKRTGAMVVQFLIEVQCAYSVGSRRILPRLRLGIESQTLYILSRLVL